MYGWIWRHLPGPTAVRVVVAVALVVGVVAACFTWVFPAVAEWLPFTDVTVDRSSSAPRR